MLRCRPAAGPKPHLTRGASHREQVAAPGVERDRSPDARRHGGIQGLSISHAAVSQRPEAQPLVRPARGQPSAVGAERHGAMDAGEVAVHHGGIRPMERPEGEPATLRGGRGNPASRGMKHCVGDVPGQVAPQSQRSRRRPLGEIPESNLLVHGRPAAQPAPRGDRDRVDRRGLWLLNDLRWRGVLFGKQPDVRSAGPVDRDESIRVLQDIPTICPLSVDPGEEPIGANADRKRARVNVPALRQEPDAGVRREQRPGGSLRWHVAPKDLRLTVRESPTSVGRRLRRD